MRLHAENSVQTSPRAAHYGYGMGQALRAADEQILVWRRSPAEARRRLAVCARAFEQSAGAAEEALDRLLHRPAPTREGESAERFFRWKRKAYILFWLATAALSLGALAAGYLAGFWL